LTDNHDRRLNKIHLTEHAKSIKDEITEVAINSTNSIIRDIPKEELVAFIKVLNKMSENILSDDQSGDE
jgi:uncharacterized FlaG/YvyC family protein